MCYCASSLPWRNTWLSSSQSAIGAHLTQIKGKVNWLLQQYEISDIYTELRSDVGLRLAKSNLVGKKQMLSHMAWLQSRREERDHSGKPAESKQSRGEANVLQSNDSWDLHMLPWVGPELLLFPLLLPASPSTHHSTLLSNTFGLWREGNTNDRHPHPSFKIEGVSTDVTEWLPHCMQPVVKNRRVL